MAAEILDGKKLAERVRARVRERAAAFEARAGRKPGLDLIVVGDDAGSLAYVRSKEKAARDVGMTARVHALPAATTSPALVARILGSTGDPAVDAVLLQLPLPAGLSAHVMTVAIDPWKDVDGLHPFNAGLLASTSPYELAPCTPVGCMHLIRESGVALAGARAVVIGRSDLVGRPMAQLLLRADATVTMAHSKTRDLAAICREADVLVVAAGKPGLVRGDWIKEGAVVVDVGNTRVDGKVVGDVAFDEAKARAGWITPVPGGVGPMTIACLLENTVVAAEANAK